MIVIEDHVIDRDIETRVPAILTKNWVVFVIVRVILQSLNIDHGAVRSGDIHNSAMMPGSVLVTRRLQL